MNDSLHLSGLPGAMFKGQVSTHAAAAINDKWFGGSRPDHGQIAADAFGNTLGSWAVDQLGQISEQAQQRRQLNDWTEGELQRASARDEDVQAFAAGPDTQLGLNATTVFYVDNPATRAASGAPSAAQEYAKMDEAFLGNGWNSELDLSSLGGYVQPSSGKRDEDVPYVGSGQYAAVGSGIAADASIGDWLNDHTLIAREGYNGDVGHDLLAGLSNVGNLPLNGAGYLVAGLDYGLRATGLDGLIEPLMGLPGFGVGARVVEEGLLGMRELAAVRAEARVAGSVPNSASDFDGAVSGLYSPVTFKRDGVYLDYSSRFEGELENFNSGFEHFSGALDSEMVLVQFHSSGRGLSFGRSAAWWTTPEQGNAFSTIDGLRQGLALPTEWGARDGVSIARIPRGTNVEFVRGTAAVQKEGGIIYEGNGLQMLFKEFNPAWIEQTRKIPGVGKHD